MRLKILDAPSKFAEKIVLVLARLVLRSDLPDVAKIFRYRSEFFGRPFCDLAHSVLRGPSEWTVGERELFGAYTSLLNQCVFCLHAHGAVASMALGKDVTASILTDRRTAGVSPKLEAALGMIETLTLRPDKIKSADVAFLHSVGASRTAVMDLIYICAGFNIINRIADA